MKDRAQSGRGNKTLHSRTLQCIQRRTIDGRGSRFVFATRPRAGSRSPAQGYGKLRNLQSHYETQVREDVDMHDSATAQSFYLYWMSKPLAVSGRTWQTISIIIKLFLPQTRPFASVTMAWRCTQHGTPRRDRPAPLARQIVSLSNQEPALANQHQSLHLAW